MLEGTNVVLLATLVVWIALFVYLWQVDKRVSRLSREVETLHRGERKEPHP